MPLISKIHVATGVYWVEIAQANFRLLCGCPADAVKLLRKRGLIETIQKDGKTFESGPNAILLSELLIQNGSFANLTEFPVLQMLYMQGMILPGHPGNTGAKPLLIGEPAQLSAQMQYIHRGNYGLTSVEEIMATGIPEAQAREMMQIKLRFAFGKITPPDTLIRTCAIRQDEQPIELVPGVLLRRSGVNQYIIEFGGESVDIDLNLPPYERYEAAYQLGYHFFRREYFAVIHSGEGDGWDIHRPCMASVLVFQGRIYLIDAGPNILASLHYLGISVNEVEGIFHTHAHDDHFAGLTTLIRTDRRFRYYATPLVRASVTKKLCALMSVSEERFGDFFEVHDLPFDQWSDVEGLSVMPVYSPHPIETNIFIFRAAWANGYKTYAHLADITAVQVLDQMADGKHITAETLRKVKTHYFAPADLKKIDAGGGMIHGNAEDFVQDASAKMVLAHTSKPLTLAQREIGSSAAFGMVDVLIPAQRDYMADAALRYLRFYFPEAPEHDLLFLQNHPITAFNAGSILLRKNAPPSHIYLLLNGVAERVESGQQTLQYFPAGSLLGFYAEYLGNKSPATYTAASNLNALMIPTEVYNAFIRRNHLYEDLRRMEELVLFLGKTWLLGEVVSFPILARIARTVAVHEVAAGSQIQLPEGHLMIIAQGVLQWQSSPHRQLLQAHDVAGCETRVLGKKADFFAQTALRYYTLPFEQICQVPVAHWRLLEAYERRIH